MSRDAVSPRGTQERSRERSSAGPRKRGRQGSPLLARSATQRKLRWQTQRRSPQFRRVAAAEAPRMATKPLNPKIASQRPYLFTQLPKVFGFL
ncbi:hypothetical protein HPP92_006854 [Vanilla planifolia]|uniref:Uncharacterized protein n=1 Tax=Vanilla planifolia TaxID=51239 RepID=A0A835RJ90_VANPL|nr:hypothetical protein HPP92_007086 [Vanilla planifolia]KAG0489991.1 hypothetical protein HPP92_006854 [Vanilla planifolia]